MKKSIGLILCLLLVGCSNIESSNNDMSSSYSQNTGSNRVRTQKQETNYHEKELKREEELNNKRITEVENSTYIELSEEDLIGNTDEAVSNISKKINNNIRYVLNQVIDNLDVSDDEKNELKVELYENTYSSYEYLDSSCEFDVKLILEGRYDDLLNTNEKMINKLRQSANEEDLSSLTTLSDVDSWDGYQDFKPNENYPMIGHFISLVLTPRYDEYSTTVKNNIMFNDTAHRLDMIKKCEKFVVAETLQGLNYNHNRYSIDEAVKIDELLKEYNM